MSLLFTIVRAAHANGTHHKLALDALMLLQSEQAEDWRRLFISQAETYMKGAKTPDDVFKDFQNHVLHVRDAYWGGAPAKAEAWYAETVTALKAQDWTTAIYNAGILTHYLSDPLMPFHTAQSEAENNIHAACEQSVSKSYEDLKVLAEKMLPPPNVRLGSGQAWVREAVIASAEASNPHYEALIAHFDIHKAVVDPPSGLDQNARRIVADMLDRARVTIALVLDKALAEAAVAPPQVSLTAETLLAGLKIPLKWVTKKIADAAEKAEIERMYDELQATGTVEKTLRADERTVRAAHQAEVVEAAKRTRERERAQAVGAPVPAAPLAVLTPRPAAEVVSPQTAEGAAAAAPTPPASLVDRLTSVIAAAPVPVTEPTAAPVAPQPPAATEAAPMAVRPADDGIAAATAAAVAAAIATPKAPRPIVAVEQKAARNSGAVSVTDDVERAPSIGPKTAARLHAAGVKTIADLLAADPGALSEQLNTDWINAKLVRDWQDQAKLVTTVPGLRGGAAQLLVGAGCRSVAKLAMADSHDLMASVLKFAGTSEGQRILRDAPPPDLEKISGWISSARTVKAA